MKSFCVTSLLFCFATALSGNPGQKHYNFFHFTEQAKKITTELDSLTPPHFKSHPEFGVLPQNAPCEDCVELQEKRDASSRYFIANGTGGRKFYLQHSYGNINYLDESGWWRAIDYHLKPAGGTVFEAPSQPDPVKINLGERCASILYKDRELSFDRDLQLYLLTSGGSLKSLGTPDWSHFTAGDDGVLIENFYPGIDLQVIALEGAVKTNFILNKRFNGADGWLLMTQKIKLPDGFYFDQADSLSDEIKIEREGNEYFRIHSTVVYDAGETPEVTLAANKINSTGELLTYIPCQWLSKPELKYPVVIDPLVTVSGTIAQASIPGSQYSPVCWTNGCTYSLTVPSPSNCTITNISYSFDYAASGLCTMLDGGFSFNYAACHSPASGAYTCPLAFGGTCASGNVSLMNDFAPCLQPPQCNAYNMTFTMHFYRCNHDPTPGCSSGCISAASAWTMTVTGETVQIAYISPPSQICEGISTRLIASAQNGVPPYLFLWTPPGNTNDTIQVTPASTTVYHVTVTDGCGNSVSDSTTVNVVQDNNPGFTISPNPVCSGQNVTLTANGGQTNYNWQIPGSTNPSVTNAGSVITQFSSQGTYIATMNSTNGVCIFPVQQSITVSDSVLPSVNIQASPGDTLCAGVPVTFQANSTNGGTSPSFQWFVNGTASGNNSSFFSSSTLNPGNVVIVKMTSNEQCIAQHTVTSNAVTLYSYPPVSVSAGNDLVACPGEPVTLLARASGGNGGPYQYIWAPGNLSDNPSVVFTSATTIYTVQATDACNGPAYDTITVSVLQGPSGLFSYSPESPSSYYPEISFFDLSQNAASWLWNFGDGDSSRAKNPEHLFPGAGQYDVTLVVSNQSGCRDTVTMRIIVNEDAAVFIPNSFTPNGDGRNETFAPFSTTLGDYEMIIYDRWGNQVFKGEGASSWNGNYQGTSISAPGGIYVYKIQLKDAKFGNRMITGRVTLIR